MKEKLIMMALIFSLSVNLVALITFGYFWHVNYREIAREPNRGKPFLLERLNLDRKQWDSMRELRRSLLDELTPLREELTLKRRQLIELLSSKVPDRLAIDRTLAEINGLQLKVEQLVVDHLLKEKRFLTPAQQARYFDFIYEKCRCGTYSHPEKGHERGRRGREGRGRGMSR